MPSIIFVSNMRRLRHVPRRHQENDSVCIDTPDGLGLGHVRLKPSLIHLQNLLNVQAGTTSQCSNSCSRVNV